MQAIQAGVQQLELTGPCTGCGRCQAACPAGALAGEGFDRLGPSADPRRVAIDCRRAPAEAADTVRVPCLGGLSDAQLLMAYAEAPDVSIVLLDRGGCRQCESGGAEHPAQATVQRVAGWLAEAGVPTERLPRIEAADAPLRAGNDPMQRQGRSRRGFFAALARPVGEPPRSVCMPALSRESSARQQTLAAMQRLVSRHGGRMPRAMFHRLEVGPACDGHRVCASACPTGALLRWRDDDAGRMGIAFDGAACIGCGHCVSTCPQQALQLHRGQGTGSAGRRPLTAFAQCICPDCGSRFAARDGDEATRCERCRKTANLARSAFQTMFCARPKTPGTGVFSTEEQ